MVMSIFSKKSLFVVPVIAAMTAIGCSASNAEQNAPFVYQDIEPTGFAGSYLASHHAQNSYDWKAASGFLDQVLALDPENAELIRRSMILAIGTGDLELAAKRAQTLIVTDPTNDLAYILMTLENIKGEEFDAAAETLAQMPEGDMGDFIKPLLTVWVSAGQGALDTTSLQENSIHRYHGALAAFYLGDFEKAKALATEILASGTISNHDAVRVADILAVTGAHKDALALYEGVMVQDNENNILAEKIAAVKADQEKDTNEAIKALVPDANIESAVKGTAVAMYDMAYILHREYSDSSTKLFANMALALDGHMTSARLLLADTLTRNGRYKDAITQLADIDPSHPSYLPAQRHAAELMAEAGDLDGALAKLNTLFTQYNDIEALIRIGDLYRQEENFKNALTAYNKAAKQLGGDTIPAEYWHLLYARGMAYEREGKWNNAEADLKAALVYQPNHPYLLNYLGYGWADQGMNLQESLELIKRAVALRPYDGYIIDSLGWVQYRMGLYDEALPNLEKAVSLLPYDSTINDHLGDVYWQLGRHTEARFQWERAVNYSEGETDISLIEQKLKFGMDGVKNSKQASK
ncbi:MAG: tetratricopeptide repeat protein [Pseudomonadota bacterium]|nr:tetratricopeptide repeat protein [Pseudomonadota bacterium]